MRPVLRLILRVLFASSLLALPAVAAPPASALSCVLPETPALLDNPGVIVGGVIAADVEKGRLTLRVDEVLNGGPFPGRLELPGAALGWDDWTSPQMRRGPVLFVLDEGEDGVLRTGACSFQLDTAIIEEARDLARAAGTTSEPRVGTASNPALAPDGSDSRGRYVVAGLAGLLLVSVTTVLVLRRRHRLT